MKLSELLKPEEYTTPLDITEIDIENITTSQEKIKRSTLFVLQKSICFDVKNIINYVLMKKPAAIILEKEYAMEADVPIITVKSTRAILPYLFSRFFNIDYKKMRFIGVTGTNGKTTTATLIKNILRGAGKKIGFIGTGIISIDDRKINEKYYSMTTPDPEQLYSSIKQMENEGCEAVIMEVSSHALHFDKVLPIPFEISVFLNLSPEHMDIHQSIEDYYQTKLQLFKQSEIGIFNMDDKFSKRAYSESNCKKYSIGIIQNADVMVKDIIMHGLCGSEYIYRDSSKIFKVKLKLPGAYNIYNSVMALSCAIAYGVRPCVAKEIINNIENIEGRFEIINSSPCVIIDYAHTEDALKNFLKTVNKAKSFEQNLITVFGCGGDRYREKRAAMAEIAEAYSDFVIVTTDNSRTESEIKIIKDILSGFKTKSNKKVILSRQQAINYALEKMTQKDILVIVGKGHERYNIDKFGYHDFDERYIIKEALSGMKGGVEKSNGAENRVTADA